MLVWTKKDLCRWPAKNETDRIPDILELKRGHSIITINQLLCAMKEKHSPFSFMNQSFNYMVARLLPGEEGIGRKNKGRDASAS